MQMPEEYIKFGHGRFLPHIFQFFNPYQPVISRYAVKIICNKIKCTILEDWRKRTATEQTDKIFHFCYARWYSTEATFQIHAPTALPSGETAPGTNYIVDRMGSGFDPKVTGEYMFAPAGGSNRVREK
jgi:hypothetical protein